MVSRSRSSQSSLSPQSIACDLPSQKSRLKNRIAGCQTEPQVLKPPYNPKLLLITRPPVQRATGGSRDLSRSTIGLRDGPAGYGEGLHRYTLLLHGGHN